MYCLVYPVVPSHNVKLTESVFEAHENIKLMLKTYVPGIVMISLR